MGFIVETDDDVISFAATVEAKASLDSRAAALVDCMKDMNISLIREM